MNLINAVDYMNIIMLCQQLVRQIFIILANGTDATPTPPKKIPYLYSSVIEKLLI